MSQSLNVTCCCWQETAKMLARCGGTVILACRDPCKASAAAAELNATPGVPANTVHPMHLDVSSLSSIEAFASEFRTAYPMGCHVLVNNAGAMLSERESVDFCGSSSGGGVMEKTMAVNHLGPFALTQILLPSLIQAGEVGGGGSSGPKMARVVHVSSRLCKNGVLAADDLEGDYC